MSTQTYTPSEAAKLTGYCQAAVRRHCQRGNVGQGYTIPGTDLHYYTLSPADIDWLTKHRAKAIGEKQAETRGNK